jgi:hypothetical protein
VARTCGQDEKKERGRPQSSPAIPKERMTAAREDSAWKSKRRCS